MLRRAEVEVRLVHVARLVFRDPVYGERAGLLRERHRAVQPDERPGAGLDHARLVAQQLDQLAGLVEHDLGAAAAGVGVERTAAAAADAARLQRSLGRGAGAKRDEDAALRLVRVGQLLADLLMDLVLEAPLP